MPEIDSKGVRLLTELYFNDRLTNIYKTALGDQLDVSPETPQGQVIDLDSKVWRNVEKATVIIIKSLDIDSADGIFLDYLGTLLGIKRRRGTKTTISATVGGVAGTVIAKGSKAATLTTGHEFQTDYQVTIGTGGNVDVAMSAVSVGPIEVVIGELTSIVELDKNHLRLKMLKEL